MRACKTTVMTEFCNKKLTKKYAKIIKNYQILSKQDRSCGSLSDI